MFQANNAMGGTPKHIKKDWGLGGVLIMGDAEDGKKTGTMLWGGYPNLIWVRHVESILEECAANQDLVGGSQDWTMWTICGSSFATR